MSVGHAFAIALEGLKGHVIRVECDVSRGLPGINVVGMGDAAVVQAKDRIRSALTNTGLTWPGSRTVMSLSPAAMPKTGSGYDVSMVCAMLAAQRQELVGVLEGSVVMGELGLDGTLRAIQGVFPMVVAAARHGFRRIVVPAESLVEASHAAAMIALEYPGFEVLPAACLAEVIAWMEGRPLAPVDGDTVAEAQSVRPDVRDMADVVGQPEARRAVEIAAAGGHALMLTGPPGSGKSMLARRLPGILPRMTAQEQMEAAAIHSIAGVKGNLGGIWDGMRPFIAPHQSVTASALIGGGANPQPGAVSLAHAGVLFLDEVAEARRDVIDSLRVPLEARSVEIVRNRRIVHYPASFQLVLAANPCPCGAEFARDCTCTPGARTRYQAKLSGPLCDRIDIFARTRSSAHATLRDSDAESSELIRSRVEEARQRASERWKAALSARGYAPTNLSNANVPGTILRWDYAADDEGMLVLQDMLRTRSLTQRGVDRTLRVAWTLADCRAKNRPGLSEIFDSVEMYTDGEADHDLHVPA